VATIIRSRWTVDLALAGLLAVLGLIEIWLPLESVMGDGSPVVSSVGVLWFALHLTQRRARPWVALAGLAVWPILGLAQDGRMQVLFFGQLVPVMVLVYSLARHGDRRVRWSAAVGGIAFVTLADVFIPLLRDPSELIFHWASVTLSFVLGNALRVFESRAREQAVRAHVAETEARERALAAVAEERARIARELHDIVAHAVGVMVVQAGAAEQVVEEDPEYARAALGTIRTTGSSALAEMRRLVTVLREPTEGTDLTPQPGLATLPELVERARRTGLEVELTVQGEDRPLPVGLDLAAYRIIQEALTNVRRHSRATRARVRLALDRRHLCIEVDDDGPSRPPDHGGGTGHGLIGMRERAALYGGRIEAGPCGTGYGVRAVLPLEES
jgi:signal transduction histidine kinase